MSLSKIHQQSEAPPPGSRGSAGDGQRGPALTVATAVFNAQDRVLEGLRAWNAQIAKLAIPAEIVLVDDGSTDGTAENMEKLPREIPFLRVITLATSVGIGGATARALRESEGAHVLVCGLGFDLAAAPALLEARERGRLDVLCGYREPAPADGLAAALNRTLAAKFSLAVRDAACPVKLLTRDAARSMLLEAKGPEVHGEIAVKAARNGLRVGEAAVRAPAEGDAALTFGEKRRLGAFIKFLRKKDALFRRGVIRAV